MQFRYLYSIDSGDSLPSLPSTFSTLSDSNMNLRNVWEGQGSLKTWAELPQLLRKDKRRIKEIDVKGFGLVEAVCEALEADLDIHLTTQELLDKVSQELTDHLEYTRFLKSPLCKRGVEYDMIQMTEVDYGRAVCDLYLPAIASCLDVCIRVLKKVGNYFAVMTTSPLDVYKKKDPNTLKRINLIYSGYKYKPIVWNMSDTAAFGVEAEVEGKKAEEPEGTASQSPTEANSTTEMLSRINMTPLAGRVISQTSNSSIGGVDCPIVISDEEDFSTPKDLNARVKEETPVTTIKVEPSASVFSLPSSIHTSTHSRVMKNKDEESCLSLSANQSESSCSLPSMPRKPATRIPFTLNEFEGMIPEVVDTCPYDINGLKYYLIDVPEDKTMFFYYWDGRYFQMNTSRRKGFGGVRRVGTCRGNPICNNPACGFLIENHKKNEVQFKAFGNTKFCSICDSEAERKPCGAKKLIEFHLQTRLLQIYHKGEHTCIPQQKKNSKDDFITSAIKRHGVNTTPKELAQLEMTAELNRQLELGVTDMDSIINIAAKLVDKTRINNIRATMQQQVQSEKHSLSSVAGLKEVTDTTDKYLIYKIHDHNMTGVGESFVFKSSLHMGKFALNMDVDSQVSSVLQDEPAYFDGMHRRCEGWKTLTLWMYHPNPQRLYRLATMEVKGETSSSVGLFWETFNSMLSEIKGEDYKFNPKLWVTDEAGANFNGLNKVYQNAAQKAVTCQFHYLQCLRRMLAKFPPELPELRQEFEQLMLQMLTATTIQEYNDLKGRVQEITALVPAVQVGLRWWLARRYNLFPIFRGFCISSLNLAEIGHSTLKKKKPLTLVDAAWEDVCTAILQEQEHRAFLQGMSRSGKGPSATELATKSKKQQMKRSKDYQRAFKNREFNLTEEGGHFVPHKRAKHRPNENIPPNVQGDEDPVDLPRECSLSQLSQPGPSQEVVPSSQVSIYSYYQ